MKIYRILQWNSRSVLSNKGSFEKFLEENDINISLVSGTWLKPNIDIIFNGYNIFRKDRKFSRGGGVLVLI